ncbi:thioesterase II family protein [Sinosporangium siamense]|uniref:Thioesterase n=1 Tax=Sinosporangium siamense TaxID=1367973 RepID=A0A919RK94_9ACTN|nr:alpha/beta fold hydrolase [Sinosporangium siamense]GII95395.1 thioesterase [Sinosporangium siamense]
MTTADLWFRSFHTSTAGDDLRIVCFPHAGGSATYYRPLSAVLSPYAEVVAVQYPGRQDRFHEPIPGIGELADRIAGAMRAEGPRRRVFFGHSMGAVVAYEVARRLGPAAVFASGRRGPSVGRPETVHLLDDAGVIAHLRSLGGTEAVLLDDPDLRELVFPAVRGDYRAVAEHRPGERGRLDCPLIVMTGDADPLTGVADAEAWREVAGGGFEVRVFPGGHFYLAEAWREVAGAMVEILEKLQIRTR